MSDESERLKTPTDVLITALERVEEMQHVLVIGCSIGKDDSARIFCLGNSLSPPLAIYLLERIKHEFLETDENEPDDGTAP